MEEAETAWCEMDRQLGGWCEMEQAETAWHEKDRQLGGWCEMGQTSAVVNFNRKKNLKQSWLPAF